jgi:stearoyl-CoA desaturase (Delta-9 desaturase)
MFQKKYYYPFSGFCAFLLPAILFTPFNGQSFFYNMMVAGFARYIISLHATFCVNSLCHMFGSRPFNKDILPTENLLVSIITMGEGWHNWHHEYPKDWRASKNEWWMFNPCTSFI